MQHRQVSTALYLFGPPRLERDGQSLQLGSRKALALLAYLAANPHPQARDRLAALLWPESDQAQARASLRRTLHALKPLVESRGDTVGLAPGLEVDVDDFRQGRLERYTGPFMDGFSLPDCPELESWMREQREQLEELCKGALDRLTGEESPAEALVHARRRLALDPLDEAAHRQVMTALIRSGQRAAARRQYDECARILREELGAEPDPETRRLAATLTEPAARTRYVARDGVHIAYQVLGRSRPGVPDLVLVNGFVSHLELAWEGPQMAAFLRGLGELTRVILFDKRGVGLSDRVGAAPTLQDTMDDLLAVMDAAGVERAVLLGASEGGPASALVAATHPRRVQGLIVYGSLACGTRTEDHPWAMHAEQHARWQKLLLDHWGEPVHLDAFAPSLKHDPDFCDWAARYLRSASSPGNVVAVLEVFRQIDVRDILPAINVPTLVLHRRDDRAIRAGAGRRFAELIPGARYVELSGSDHWWWVGDQASILAEIRAFLEGSPRPLEPERVLATVVAMDRPVQAVPRGSLLPDGCCVLFDGPTRALEFARGRAREGVRVGVHAGECALSGAPSPAIQVARELAEKALPGEALLTGTVRELVIGTPLEFVPRGELPLAGVDGWRVLQLTL